MPTQLARRIQQELDKGKSIRGLGRDIGLSNSTIRKILGGERVDPETLNKVADHFNLLREDVYRMAEVLPSPPPTPEELPAEEQFVIRQIIANYTRSDREGKRRLAEFILWLPDLTPENQEVVLDLIKTLRNRQAATET